LAIKKEIIINFFKSFIFRTNLKITKEREKDITKTARIISKAIITMVATKPSKGFGTNLFYE
jgi:hypothetical protein